MKPSSVMEHSTIVHLGNELAAASAEWLAAKVQSGFKESLLSEALLIVPLVEYFATRATSTEWCLTGEWHESGTSLAKAGDVNIDLVAEHEGEKVLLEFKYLKRANDQRLIKDFVKLALPKNASYTRLLLVAHSPSCQHQGESKSALVRSLISAGRKIVFHLAQRDSLPELTSDLNIKHSLTGAEGEHVSRIMSYDSSVADFAVQHIATCPQAEENVSVFSVSRVDK
ncbi:hypothetical protein [Bradyrhizobium sp. F1.13.3]|uniref:hypothetical protein n=1 Tax=Bradyrhizobium sp. F1.13.3 TaxID=3156351 RepID=UPI00339ACD6D